VKVAFKYNPDIEISMGNHCVYNLVDNMDQVYFLADDDICLNHLPIRSVSQIKGKVINGGKSISGLSGGAHWKERYVEYLKIGDSYFEKLVSDFVIQ
jgi:hypothetical protein